MINDDLLSLLERVLGKGRKTSGSNYSFYSPFIQHYKPKLEINLEASADNHYFWHCWVSNEKGRTIHSLFKKIKVDEYYISELNKLLKTTSLYSKNRTKVNKQVVKLPDEFIKLSDYPKIKDISVSIQLRQAINYLKNRGIISTDIFRYNIGYCLTGQYGGNVVIPSYDENCNLNYFVARTIFDDVSYKYKKPKISQNIIGFESLINWKERITLVEGVFDAISSRYNTIPLFGKTLSPLLKEKLLIRKPPLVMVALDGDALKDSIKICNFLISNGIKTSLIKMSDNDINEIGFHNFSKKKLISTEIDSFDLLKERVLL